ncbi:substrate-binding domain-containing protein [Sphaerochaeta sp.]|uniref:substrate-binding domain-containing protein n=1 Tax=Sphaerochaeta sp. TaxID=1972642 RepID=UPI00258919BC|nr:substrate-binding domain-containing protein [Sphaerochaeta sp.]MDD3057793.1 substrate-binding domain-containing protein [Sphaerochaeta sp.]MDD3457370.1 substrate-binding domain-containing protein [Sphaerochaeta sp.]HPE93810.1 substrate-binding domain-containing protein [Sphaerochaeta sp.]
MKKAIAMVLILSVCLSVFAAGSKEVESAKGLSSVEAALRSAEKMSNEQLYELAKQESGSLKVYSTTSLCGTAAELFMTKYPGLKVAYSSVGETDMFTKLETEIGTAADGADMALLQNAYLMQSLLIDEGSLLNYFPQMYKDVIPAEYQSPTAMLLVNKLFMWNNTGGDIGLDNIWQLAEPEYKGKIYFKDPNTEPVGMNFLIMLTSPEWNAKIEAAYKDLYGKAWTQTNNKLPSAAHEWIDKFLANCSFEYTADGGIATGLTNGAPGNVGLFVFSKLRGNAAAREKLSVAADLNCFAGFMYPTYAQVCKDTDMPYTSALFINFILSEEGSSPWTNEGVMGNYSVNTSIPLQDGTGIDHEVDYWLERCVVEDGQYLASVYADVFEFISIRIK